MKGFQVGPLPFCLLPFFSVHLARLANICILFSLYQVEFRTDACSLDDLAAPPFHCYQVKRRLESISRQKDSNTLVGN